MGRKRRPFVRPVPFRDIRLIIIATEGEATEKAYFETLVEKEYYYNPGIHVEVLPSKDGKSAPAWVFENLNQFKKEYELLEDDTLFLVIDKDRWEEQALSETAQLCAQADFSFILSNPCFEIWILLHLVDISYLPETEKQKLFLNKKISKNRRYIEHEIIKRLGSYNRTNPDFSIIMRKVNDAIKNAEKLDVNPEERWPNSLGTRVYLIVKEILEASGTSR